MYCLTKFNLIKVDIKRSILHFHSNFFFLSHFFQTAPKAPQNLTVHPTATKVTLTWMKPANTSENHVDGYIVMCNGTVKRKYCPFVIE